LKQRGRKSAEELAVVSLASARKTMEPPTDLRPAVCEIFREVVASCDANHFRKSDIPMLAQFAVATHLSRFYAERIGETDGAFKLWSEAAKLQISLATKLRLTVQSRAHPRTIARQTEPHEPGTAPWE